MKYNRRKILKMNNTTYKDSVKSMLKNKSYVIALVLITIAAFGFEITHFSLGIDDFGINHYMDLSPDKVGNMLQQGRILHIMMYYLSGLVDVIPFLNNFIGSLLFFFSAVFFMALFEVVSEHEFSTLQKIIFSGLFVSYSITSFKFIYDIDVVVTMMSYVCVPLSVAFALDFCDTKKIGSFIKSVCFLFIAIGSYESFNAVYICTIIFSLILVAIYKDEKTINLIKKGMVCCVILITSLVVYYLLVKVLQVMTGNIPYARTNIFSMGFPIANVLRSIINRLLNVNLFFAIEFVIFAIISVGLAIYFSCKKKNPFIFIMFFGFGFFTLFVQIIQGYLYYRSCQTFNLFIACIALLCTEILWNKKICKQIVSIVMGIVLVNQLKDINLWFYKDYINYNKNVYAIHRIATDLNSAFPVHEKPVCFLNRDYESFLMTWDEDQKEIGESPIVSAIGFLGDATSPELIQLFKYQGYDFIIEPTIQQIQSAREKSVGMPHYPQSGYIQEENDYIIVNLGELKDSKNSK